MVFWIFLKFLALNICANNYIDHVKGRLFLVLQVLSLFFVSCNRKENDAQGKQPLKMFWEKDIDIDIVAEDIDLGHDELLL